jgi:hypothetical protein
MIATKIIPYAGNNEAAGKEVERIIAEFARNHPHLPHTDNCVSVSGQYPAKMSKEAWPGCEWARPDPWEVGYPKEPEHHHGYRPNEDRVVLPNGGLL